MYAVFIDLEKPFDRVKWDILLRNLKKYGVDWRERRVIRTLYVKQKARVRINRGNWTRKREYDKDKK